MYPEGKARHRTRLSIDNEMKFNVILEPAEEGGYNVSVPALDGCYTQGDTEEEVIKNAKETILCYLEGFQKLNEINTMVKKGLLRNDSPRGIWEISEKGRNYLKEHLHK